MSRLMSNCSTIWVLLTLLREVISVTPAMAPRCRSSGVATLEDMVSGLAPAMLAETLMVGMSTLGSGATGSSAKAPMPDRARPVARRAVAMGRRIKTEIMGAPQGKMYAAVMMEKFL